MPTRSSIVTTYGPNGTVVGTKTITWEISAEQDNEETLRARINGALTANKTYVALANPTAAQSTAQVKALTQQMNALLRLVGNKLDATD